MTYLLRANERGDILDASGKVVGMVVPVEPTREMLQAAQASEIEGYHGDYLVAEDCYAAMLSAATLDLEGLAVKMPTQQMFEQWYANNAFDYVANPIGSRDCGLQRKAWIGCIDALGIKP